MKDYKEKREQARKRVQELKSFHQHIVAFVLINILLLFIRGEIFDFLVDRNPEADLHFGQWININFVITFFLWGIGLSVHGIYAYRHKWTFFKNWEERQIRKFMEQEESNEKKYR